MKNKIPRATLVIWGIIVAIVIVMATVCIVLILQGKWGIDGNDSSDYIEIKEENIQQDISVIHLNWVSGDVQVKKSSNNQIRIVQKGSQDYPQEQLFSTKIDGDTLYIEDTRGHMQHRPFVFKDYFRNHFCRERKVRLNRIKYNQWRYFCKPYKNRRVSENGFCKRSCYSNGK